MKPRGLHGLLLTKAPAELLTQLLDRLSPDGEPVRSPRPRLARAWTMTFAPGDEVHVAALGKAVVREVRNGGHYLVELKGRSIVAAEAQLSAVSPRKRPPSSDARASPTREPDAATPSYASTSLDLHGMTVEEAVAALDAFLNDALLAGHPEVRVIHGRSGGRLKAAVHARVKQLPAVRATRLDPANPGVTIVTL